MTTVEKNKDMMGTSVTQTLSLNEPTWTSSPLFTESVDQHGLNMASIRNWAEKQQQQLELKGLVQDKNLLRLVMVDSEMLRIIAALKAVGAATNDNQLITSVNKSRSKLLHMSDTAFNTFAGVLKGIANDNSAAILPLGITATMLTNYGLSCASFDTIMKKPKSFRSALKGYTTNLKTSISTMVSFLKKTMDNQVKSLYQGTEFMADYFNSRKPYHYNEERTELKGMVKSESGHKIKNAIIELVNYPTPGESLFRHTNTKGYYAFKQLDLETATIRIRAVGYIVAEYTVKIEQLKANDFDIVMMIDPAFATVPA
ncbi:MAG TPA: carboxypeptidase-like regulatory domain-containing protein [Bacteroidia bacterium]|nr:carboxypeptidase-like regulatory domain-containing protein [Bacteroidia bacterium]